MSPLHQNELLEQHLRAFLGDIDAEAMALLRKHLEWIAVAVAAGQAPVEISRIPSEVKVLKVEPTHISYLIYK